jgi:hypothetical protein
MAILKNKTMPPYGETYKNDLNHVQNTLQIQYNHEEFKIIREFLFPSNMQKTNNIGNMNS